MDKLNLYIFFVDKVGAVEEIDWKKLKTGKRQDATPREI